MTAVWQDVRYGFRMLVRSPGYTVVAVLVLAVEIGAVTAIVSVVRTTLFDPLPVRHAPDRYVRLVAVNKKQGWLSPGINPPALREVLGQMNLFARVAAYEYDSLALQGQEFVEPVPGLRVTPELFRFWTLQPRLGRFFSDEETQPGRDDVIVLSHRCWQKRFGGDPGIIGRVVQFRERLMTVGLYGVLAYSVARRTREMGIRMALGARESDVLGLVLREGTRLLGVGLVLGLAAALALGRVLRAFLFGLAPHDPLTLVGVALLLSLVAWLACYLPARPAARIDPMVALRYE